MAEVICSPDLYYGPAFQSFVASECRATSSKWIYDIIDGTFCPKREQVFIQKPEWCLCADQHQGSDPRYLVIFKDTNLKTIRDLRQSHLQLLAEINAEVRAWLDSRQAKGFKMFFHYMPSVFQLHLHVTAKTQYINMSRAHFLPLVMKNLQRSSEHYAQALIMTSACRTIRRAETHETVQGPI
jgi:diadenosine tetraphosphate (Ap4A) HIT family hydrolase